MNSLRDQLVAAGLWSAIDPRDPSFDIALTWEICGYVARMRPELYEPFTREISPLIFSMAAPFAAYNICLAALKAARTATR